MSKNTLKTELNSQNTLQNVEDSIIDQNRKLTELMDIISAMDDFELLKETLWIYQEVQEDARQSPVIH